MAGRALARHYATDVYRYKLWLINPHRPHNCICDAAIKYHNNTLYIRGTSGTLTNIGVERIMHKKYAYEEYAYNRGIRSSATPVESPTHRKEEDGCQWHLMAVVR